MGSNPTLSADSSSIAMKRQRIPQHPQQQQRQHNDYISGDVMFDPRRSHDSDEQTNDDISDSTLGAIGGGGGGHPSDIPLQQRTAAQRPRNVLEAQVQDGDTLQAIAIRYRCSVADIKRLNKIERDYEIHAHKTLQVPLTAENVLADHLLSDATPSEAAAAAAEAQADHLRSVLAAQAEQHYNQNAGSNSRPATASTSTSTTGFANGNSDGGPSINEIILNTKIQPNQYMDAADAVNSIVSYDNENALAEEALLIGGGDDAFVRQPRPIRATGVMGMDLSCSGSDCDISWTVLLVCILALCFIIPLIYVLYIAEHHVEQQEPAVGSHQHVVSHHDEHPPVTQRDEHWDA